ncbi:hypothetical protein [Nocardia sp. NPDC057440]
MANAWVVIMLALLVGIGAFGLLGLWVPACILIGLLVVGIVISLVVQA